jgi:UDP-glucose:(heptosyl)LPS alpha-1,3-glucosyltransferase
VKLIFVKKEFSPYGGAENYLKLIIEHLKRNHEIHVFAKRWSNTEGIHFHRVTINSLSSFMSILSFDRNVCRLLKSESADCVVSFERTTCQDIYRAGEGCHAEWLDIRSKVEPFYKRLSFRINPLHISMLVLERKLFENTPLIIANSKMVKNQIMHHYAVQANKITIIYNGVDLARFTPETGVRWRDAVRKDLSIPADSPVVLFVGSGFERKGLITLINSIPLTENSDLRVLVIGRGNIDKYRAKAKEKSVSDNTLFLGPHRGIEKYYAAADLFVLPTLYDPFSNATLEAMASGLPVITTKNNGVSELIGNGQEGYILDNLFNSEELADKISCTLKNIERMSSNARKRAEAFPIEKVAQEFAEAITLSINKC